MRMPNGPRGICTNAQFRPPTSQQGIHRFSEQDRQSPGNELGFHLAHRAGYPCATSTIFSAVDVRTENDGKFCLWTATTQIRAYHIRLIVDVVRWYSARVEYVVALVPPSYCTSAPDNIELLQDSAHTWSILLSRAPKFSTPAR